MWLQKYLTGDYFPQHINNTTVQYKSLSVYSLVVNYFKVAKMQDIFQLTNPNYTYLWAWYGHFKFCVYIYFYSLKELPPCSENSRRFYCGHSEYLKFGVIKIMSSHIVGMASSKNGQTLGPTKHLITRPTTHYQCAYVHNSLFRPPQYII